MESTRTRRDQVNSWSLLVMVTALSGCATPPSVAPLLTVAGLAIAEEARLVEDDAARMGQQTRQTLTMLESAYEADLRQTPQLTPQWVLEATRAYTLARETVLEHDARQRADQQRRLDNLAAALQAQRRALQLLQRQDDLLTQTVGVDGWRLGRRLLEPQPGASP